MNLKEIHEYIDKAGCLSFTTMDDSHLHSRIVHVCGYDDAGIYFLTMNTKPFYRQLKSDGRVAACGMYPASKATGRNAVGQPCFLPGFTIRISGEVREVPAEIIKKKADAGHPVFKFVSEDAERYPAIRLFCIYKGKGEIFDFDFEMENRDHKLLRKRFAFGGETYNNPGCIITDDCTGCGACAETCTFKAIEPGEPYRIRGERCDECGSCALVCPQEAIMLPETI